MYLVKKTTLVIAGMAVLVSALAVTAKAEAGQDTQATANQAGAARVLGTVKSISGNKFVLAPDSGNDTMVEVQDSTRVLRIAPGQKDLKQASPAQVQEIQSGDRVLVRGKAGADAKTLLATTVVLMKSSDIAQKQERERQDWEKRGVGGLVKSVDPATGSIVISTGPTRTVTVQTSDKTVIRRYAPGSVNFDDAVVARLKDIRPGDQLRARGNRSPDGSELAAEELVAGSFRNIAGTVSALDTAAQTITVMDLLTKKPLTVKITDDSQMHQLPPMVAQRIAMRLKGTGPNGKPGATGPANGSPGGHMREPMQAGGAGRPQRPGGADMQQLINAMPAVTLKDLKKGDAVMIVTTEPQGSGEVTAITLLTGVEPILAASPNDNRAAMLLSPWNLSSGGPETE